MQDRRQTLSTMWSLQQPSNETLGTFLAAQSGQPFSYADVGASDGGAPAGFNLDHNRIELGRGQQAFESACDALRKWQQYPNTWTKIFPANAPLKPRQIVAVLARAYGLWWLNACRIVYVIDEPHPRRRFGFAYGTLPAHAECGEERFAIEWDKDDRVWYDIRAFSRPRYLPARICYPLARRLQRRFVVDSQRAMRHITSTQG